MNKNIQLSIIMSGALAQPEAGGWGNAFEGI